MVQDLDVGVGAVDVAGHAADKLPIGDQLVCRDNLLKEKRFKSNKLGLQTSIRLSPVENK